MWTRRGLAASTGPRAEIHELEHSLIDPDIRGSRNKLEELLHPGFIGLGSSGQVYHRELMIDIMTQEAGSGGVVIRDVETQMISEDTGLVTYRSIGGSGEEARRSSLWVQDGHGWQLRFHQGTRIVNSWGRIS